jgi:hypothetical protein
VAQRLIEEGIRAGHWVFLANCHLMTSWLPTLDKLIDSLENVKPHERFRLWLSSNPAKEFPIAILQVRPAGVAPVCLASAVGVHVHLVAACCPVLWLRACHVAEVML